MSGWIKISVIVVPLLILAGILVVSACDQRDETQTILNNLELAAYWAPVWYQDTDDADPDADYITSFDFDGDFNGSNNWENQPNYPLPGYIYYWTMETDTHWFIGYAAFHPRDWAHILLFDTQHENDMEG